LQVRHVGVQISSRFSCLSQLFCSEPTPLSSMYVVWSLGNDRKHSPPVESWAACVEVGTPHCMLLCCAFSAPAGGPPTADHLHEWWCPDAGGDPVPHAGEWGRSLSLNLFDVWCRKGTESDEELRGWSGFRVGCKKGFVSHEEGEGRVLSLTLQSQPGGLCVS
jgi:hypothetical protein